jgi:hypothetical protein
MLVFIMQAMEEYVIGAAVYMLREGKLGDIPT